MLPRLELSARYTSIDNTSGFKGREGADYGTYKDKAFDAKLILFKETALLPQVAVGTHDFLGTRLFQAHFLVLGKKIGDFDFAVGAGTDRIDGAFGGIRYSPPDMRRWSLSAEYDAFDYSSDRNAEESGAMDREGGLALGINYQWGWLGSQLSWQDGEAGLNLHVSIPLQQREFIPKIHEPEPFTVKVARPTVDQWRADEQYAAALVRALSVQNFKNIRLWLRDSGVQHNVRQTTLELGVSNPRITLVGRAAGRAVRTALLMSPVDTTAIKITWYTVSDIPVVSYEFTDLDKLDRFFSGQLTYGELLNVLKVSYVEPQAANSLDAHKAKYAEAVVGADQYQFSVQQQDDGQPVTIKKASPTLDAFRIDPFNLGIFFNDPSGAFKYDLFARAHYQQYFGHALFADAVARLRVLENVSDVTQPSNSTLPHVRTDVADYKRENGFKLEKLLLNKYFLIQPRVYGRLSAGIYEEMFGGLGGQLLYLPKESNWAADLSVDALKQRDTEGEFGFRDYKTTTTLLSGHYRVKKYGMTFTLRGGKFLAKDDGVRLEFSRRFRSGFKVGAWYTRTNGNDTTGPGTPDDPYYDKGIFMQIPLNSMLTKDTSAKGGFALGPWTRDVGQMVNSPGDLYQLIEEPLLLDWPEQHLLSDFHK